MLSNMVANREQELLLQGPLIFHNHTIVVLFAMLWPYAFHLNVDLLIFILRKSIGHFRARLTDLYAPIDRQTVNCQIGKTVV